MRTSSVADKLLDARRIKPYRARLNWPWSIYVVVTDPDILDMVPPPEMWARIGSPTDFLNGGEAFFNYMVDKAHLTPAAAVLDVGCGLGKHAVHFAKFLQSPGYYEGFDVEAASIDWCTRTITPRFPHVRFRHIDVRSGMYSPENTGDAVHFRFPYGDAAFDLVFLGSVFSHMFDADMENYVREIGRVLKPGGYMLATGYLLDDAKRAGIAAGTSVFQFAHEHEGSRIERPDLPEGAVAHEQRRVEEMVAGAGMTVAEVRIGVWATENMQDQDFILTQKPL